MLFPPDVSLRIEGAVADAQRLIPLARQLLSKALRMQETGGGVPVKLFQTGTDGSLIYCFLHRGIKHLFIQPGPVQVEEEEKVVEISGEVALYLMLNGVVTPGTLIDEAAHEFHPTAVCADVYQLEYQYQDMKKLGIASNIMAGKVESFYPKPSMYSGAMKRVVQALYGIGKTKAESVADDLAGKGTLTIRNLYRCEWICTHGIFRDTQGVWLIEISKDRGVLKMKLPIIKGTESDGFLDALVRHGDSDTVTIVTEFGGLPSGLTFPEGEALDAAIIAGTVERLLTADAVKPFYVDPGTNINKEPLWVYCGWAFSDSGRETDVHNTTFWYTNAGFATIWDYERADADVHFPPHYELLTADSNFPSSVVAPIADRAKTAEHWKVTLAAERALSMVERAYLAGPQKKTYLVDPINTIFDFDYQTMARGNAGVDDQVYQSEIWGRPPSNVLGQGALWNELDCPIMVFYKGEILEVVRHQPERTYTGALPSYAHPQSWNANPSVLMGPSYVESHVGSGMSCSTTIDATDGHAHLGEVSSYTVTATDAINGAPFTPCSGATTTPDTIEYSLVFDYDFWARGDSDFYGSNFNAGVPFALHIEETATRHLEMHGIGYGSNTSVGYVDVDSGFINTASYTLISGVQYASDIEGIIYNMDMAINGSSHDNAYFVTSIVQRDPNVWRRSGSFYSTSLDLRRNEEWGNLVIFADPYPLVPIHKAYWEQKIGLVIPAFVREGYSLVRWSGGFDSGLDPVTGVPTSVTQLPETMRMYTAIHRLSGDAFVVGAETPVTAASWRQIVNAPVMRYGGSIDAGPTECGVLQDALFAEISLPPFIVAQYTPNQTFTGSAGGIPVVGCTATNATYVGAV